MWMSHHLHALLNGIVAELDTLGHLRRTPWLPARLIQAIRVMKNNLALYVLTSNSIPRMHALRIWTIMPPCPFNKIDQTQEWGAQGMHENVQEIMRRWLKNMTYFLTKYHFRIWDWYDQSNPTISESPEPPEPLEQPGTI